MKKLPPPVPIPQPQAPPPGLAADVVALGQPIHPEDRIKLFSDKQWELFVQEWVDSLRDEYDLAARMPFGILHVEPEVDVGVRLRPAQPKRRRTEPGTTRRSHPQGGDAGRAREAVKNSCRECEWKGAARSSGGYSLGWVVAE